ncbi:hypothetical protein R0135_14100 [Congregibacter variabilis]|uniref:Uncharacterized protein n=1 Tax=Congregibacter variabilis TaxID=3081200 RepID=A0ABZ0I301_9GAMM|nr:hypothetical protein R0135_14100 [Congregibacter sp. IMCC43200]
MLLRAGHNAIDRTWRTLPLEFFIIVVGFFVSLQINEWQNDRENREIEGQYLQRLENDLKKSSEALVDNNDRMRLSVSNMESGLMRLAAEHRSEDDYQTLFVALQNSSIIGGFEVYFGTFEELKDTGNMRLIESSPLRESLAALAQKYLQVVKISQIRNMLRGNTFPVMTRYVKPTVGNSLTFDAQRVEADPRELYVAMSIIRANLGYDLHDSEKLLVLIEETLTIVRAELALHH